MKILFLLMITINFTYGQDPKIGVMLGGAGGSYYDVPSTHTLSKYGTERLSPTGLAFIGTLESDQLGQVYFRKLSVARSKDQTKLGTQTLFLYDSPKVDLKPKGKVNLFVNGKVMHYDQRDHFMYFQVDGSHTPSLDKNLELEEHARVNQQQTYVAPMVGACLDGEKILGDFKLSGFTQLSLAPVALLNYQTSLVENKTPNANLDQLNKAGTTFAFGGEIVVEGVAKYKDRYYFKARILQSYMGGVKAYGSSSTNRIGHYELGYLVNKNLSLNVSAENNELLFHNKDRHAIDVYNIVGVGLKYSIPRKKKPSGL